MTPERLGPEAVLARLEALHEPNAAMAWDGDGTLWSGDVGEDTFEFVIDHVGLKPEATAALDRFAHAHGIVPSASVDATARSLLDAFRAGKIGDLPACEVMTWAYAGFRPEELRTAVEQALDRAALRTRKEGLLEPIVRWARQKNVQLLVVSASPQIVVEVAAGSLWGFSPEEIHGARATLVEGCVGDTLAEPVPFAARKRELALRTFERKTWLASFGDNFYDLEILRAARVGVAVKPKPALLSRIDPDEGILILDDRSGRT